MTDLANITLPEGLDQGPLSLVEARAWIRAAFTQLKQEFFSSVQRPMGWRACDAAPEIEQALRWYLNCEVRSSLTGLSLFLRPSTDWHEPFPLVVELRYFTPHLEISAPAPRWPQARSLTHHTARLFVDRSLPGGQRIQLVNAPLEAKTVKQLALDAASLVDAAVLAETMKGRATA